MKSIERRKDVIELMISEVSVHVTWPACFWAVVRQNIRVEYI
jgi:hypothetical protein